MAANAQQIWNALGEPWRLAFDEAWEAWRAGNLGIGAVLVDPSTSEIVAVGRNRTAEDRTEPGVLAGNFMAHAEMNAIAAMPRFKAEGLHLYTTLEPCLMCAGAAIFMHVDTVFFAAADPFFSGLDELWPRHEYSARWQHSSIGPTDQPMSGLSTVLHLTQMNPQDKAFGVVARHFPELGEVARDVADDGTLARLARDGGTVVDVLDALLPRLPAD